MSLAWDPPSVVHAAADWSWAPPDAERVTTDVTLTRWPAWAGGRVVLTGLASTRSPDDVLCAAVERARAWGSDALGVWVTAGSTPDLTGALLAHGARLEDTVEVLALPLGEHAHPPVVPHSGVAPGARGGSVVVRRVEDVSGLRDADAVDTVVWGQQPLDDDRLAEAARTLGADGAEARVVAYLGGGPVATGGVTLASAPHPGLGSVARLWGAGTLPGHRGRGAYRAVLAERLRIAQGAGASLALVKGRVSTSARILRRAGFDLYGEERCYRLAL
ncbi:hypothetical protein [Isoptericola sp. NPDC057191]|uniref:hypothetical protein n=1 Tax=Isoptericola sp. NPDC057191 TaxID=3346041 RepID=UPI003638C012